MSRTLNWDCSQLSGICVSHCKSKTINFNYKPIHLSIHNLSYAFIPQIRPEVQRSLVYLITTTQPETYLQKYENIRRKDINYELRYVSRTFSNAAHSPLFPESSSLQEINWHYKAAGESKLRTCGSTKVQNGTRYFSLSACRLVFDCNSITY